MYAIVLLLAMCHPGPTDSIVIPFRCDRIELNHYYDDQGRHIFDQYILWEWKGDCRFHVCDFFLSKRGYVLDKIDKDWVLVAHCKYRLYRITAKEYFETWSQLDHEVADREKLPKEFRRHLPIGFRDVASLQNGFGFMPLW